MRNQGQRRQKHEEHQQSEAWMKEKRKQRGEGQKQIVKYGEEYYGKAEKFVGEKKAKTGNSQKKNMQ